MRTPTPWPVVFMGIALTAAGRSKDPSSQFGAVLVGADRRILSTGFNGPPPQIHDTAVPWALRPDKYAWIIHAEENAILSALDGHGSERLQGSTLYVTGHPCSGCVLRTIRAGVRRLVWDDGGTVARCVDEVDRERTRRILATLADPHSFHLTPFSECPNG